MTGVLRLLDDGWKLENDNGTTVDSGDYPLIEDVTFIESAAEKLDSWKFQQTPYDKIDERD